jgi:excisionase family DNA binding protein
MRHKLSVAFGISVMSRLMVDYYGVAEAAKILRLTQPRVRQLLISGELEGHKTPDSDRWKIPQHAVHARLEYRRPREASTSPQDAPDASVWIEQVRELERALGRLEGQRELTEQTATTLRESLERERERADKAEADLATERSKGFWRRMFGG